MVNLVAVDLALDIILKSVAVALMVFIFLMLRNVDRAIRSLESSAESIEEVTATGEDIAKIAQYIPFVRGAKKNGK